MDEKLGALMIEHGSAIFVGFTCFMILIALVMLVYAWRAHVRSLDRRKFAGPRPKLYRIGEDWSDD